MVYGIAPYPNQAAFLHSVPTTSTQPSGSSRPLDFANFAELGEPEIEQSRQVLEREASSHRLKGCARKIGQQAIVLSCKIATDF